MTAKVNFGHVSIFNFFSIHLTIVSIPSRTVTSIPNLDAIFIRLGWYADAKWTVSKKSDQLLTNSAIVARITAYSATLYKFILYINNLSHSIARFSFILVSSCFVIKRTNVTIVLNREKLKKKSAVTCCPQLLTAFMMHFRKSSIRRLRKHSVHLYL